MSTVSAPSKENIFPVSEMAETLIGSEIIKLAAEISEKIKKGEKIYNLTIGDFDPKVFPIPVELKEEILKAYQEGHTNYPVSNGEPELRNAVAEFIKKFQGLEYNANEFLISGGARPLIYAIYKTLIDPADKVIFPVPSWNNNHYCHLSGAEPVMVETRPENNFMPTASELKPHLEDATLLALCSPLNPTGTVFKRNTLEEICDLILEENHSRGEDQKPLFLMYDQIYWMLAAGKTKHYDPVNIRPEMRDYTIYVDGLSKAFAATGLRVGWAFGPHYIIDKMKSILSHVGAWSPKAEQIASARFLQNSTAVQDYISHFNSEVEKRLNAFYNGFKKLSSEGFKVNAIEPQAAIYLTVQFNLHGMTTSSGKKLATTADITSYLVDEAKLALVPFYAFGTPDNSSWYRLSIGTNRLEEVDSIFILLRKALANLK